MTQSDIIIFDRQRLRYNRQRCSKNLNNHRFLIDWASDQVLDRVKDVKRNFSVVLQLGLRSDQAFSDQLAAHTGAQTFLKMDLSVLPGTQNAVCADEEFFPFKEHSFDLIVSIMGLHSTNDLPGALVQIKRALKPDGLFIAVLPGGESLFELRHSLMATEIDLKGGASPRVFPFADKPQMGNLMQRAGFSLPVIDSDIVTVTYPNITRLFQDLRGMGEGNIICKRDLSFPGKNFFKQSEHYYRQHFSEPDERLRASFEMIFLLGWSPHESQQKALKPGSAKLRLADALGTQEIKTER